MLDSVSGWHAGWPREATTAKDNERYNGYVKADNSSRSGLPESRFSVSRHGVLRDRMAAASINSNKDTENGAATAHTYMLCATPSDILPYTRHPNKDRLYTTSVSKPSLYWGSV